VIEVAFNFSFTHLVGMALTIKEDELTNPEYVRLFFSFRAVVLLAAGDTYLVM
jgi:hypothetical protein